MHQVIDDTPRKTLPDVEQLYARCAELSSIRAAYMLHYVFNSGYDEISHDGTTMTVMDLARRNINVPARSMLFWFWGGPPDGEDWFCGSFVTMLIDRYFYNMVDEDGDFASSMEFLEKLS